MRIIVSGGGTGGHIYPAITLIRTLQKRVDNLEVLYVGTSAGLEADIVPKEGIRFATVELRGFKRSLSPANFMRLGKAISAVFKSASIVKEFKPDVVIGTGGYVCGPVLMAASLQGIPALIQEQNVIPGITNKILSKFVKAIAVGCEDEVMNTDRDKGYAEFGLDPRKKTILVSGGSRGARSINRAMIDVIGHYAGSDSVQILHATGRDEYDDIIARIEKAGINLANVDNIKVKPYLYNMPQAMAVADLAVFRAGATGLAELTAKGIPAILIPYPYAAENHQEFNARAAEAAGAARMILNRDTTAEKLIEVIEELLSDDKILKQMAENSRRIGRPRAAADIAEIIIELARKS